MLNIIFTGSDTASSMFVDDPRQFACLAVMKSRACAWQEWLVALDTLLSGSRMELWLVLETTRLVSLALTLEKNVESKTRYVVRAAR